MVTTNSDNGEQISGQFAELTAQAIDLISSTESKEYELERELDRVLHLAIQAIIPVLKYVDEEVKACGLHVCSSQKQHLIRGIRLSENIFLARDRRVYVLFDGDVAAGIHGRVEHYDYMNLYLVALTPKRDTLVAAAKGAQILATLREAFDQAVRKASSRRDGLARRLSQLTEAAQAFEE